MAVIRTARADELDALLSFGRRYAELDASASAFRDAFEAWPELFVVGEAAGELVGGASGRVDGDRAILASVAVREEHRGDGVGRELVSTFEAGAGEYAERVSVASADNVEGFYRALGYEPVQVMLEVPGDERPEDRAPEDVTIADRRDEPDATVLYVDCDEYSPRLRDELGERFGARSVNAIYEKALRN